jgi:rhodanese-related sulfurtransferase
MARCYDAAEPASLRHTLLVAVAVDHISRESLQQKLESGADFVLVDALPPMSYATSHLPGAINLPPESVDGRAQRRIPDRGTEIVVYCSDLTCNSSVVVAKRLIELGYENVTHYAEGKNDWVAAGLPLEGGRAAGRS